jgi:hypothetical protein
LRSVAVTNTVESERSSRFAFGGRLRRSGCLSYCTELPDVVEKSLNLRGWRKADGSIYVQEGQPTKASVFAGFVVPLIHTFLPMWLLIPISASQPESGYG